VEHLPDAADNIDLNVRATRYLIVESRACCPQCDVVTRVFAFALPAGYESLNVGDDTPEDESGTWEAPGQAAVLSYVEYLPEAVAERIGGITPHYRVDHDAETGGAFWMNHCEHCGAQMMEEELHGDLDGPFGSMPDEGLDAIRWHEVHEPFAAWAGVESHDVRALDS
jgi:hypothetical protein